MSKYLFDAATGKMSQVENGNGKSGDGAPDITLVLRPGDKWREGLVKIALATGGKAEDSKDLGERVRALGRAAIEAFIAAHKPAEAPKPKVEAPKPKVEAPKVLATPPKVTPPTAAPQGQPVSKR